ncbi:MFS general substrate transporter [Mycena amicta]|nr:MFS general substrate transporter [Mycena amicta]
MVEGSRSGSGTATPPDPILSNNASTKTPATFPEGGFRAWATVAGAFLIQFGGFGYTTSFGVYEDFYTREYLSDSAPSTIALVPCQTHDCISDALFRWIGSVSSFIIVSSGLISGRLFDRGYFYSLLYGGSLLQCFSLFMLSLCKPQQLYQIFLAQGIGLGLGAGIVYVPCISVISHYFHRRRPLAMSIVAAGSSLGAVIHPIMLNNLLHKPGLGFASAVRASAGTVTGVVLIACLLMHPRLPPPATLPPFWKSIRRFGRDVAYVLSTLGMVTVSIGLYFPLFYFQLDAVTHGIDEQFAFYSLVIMNAASFLGRLSPGLFLPSLGHYGVMYLITGSAACSTVLILSMIALRTTVSVVVIGVLYGLASGMFITLMAPLVAFLTEDMSELGLRIGVSFAVVAIGGLVGPPIHGALLTGHYIWLRPALFSGIIAAFGSFCLVSVIILLRRKHRQAKLDSGLEVDRPSDSLRIRSEKVIIAEDNV